MSHDDTISIRNFELIRAQSIDNTSFNSMVMASLDHGIDGTSPKWINSKFKNRTVRAKVRGVSSVMEVRRGCPQGGVLLPLLWNMVIDGLLRCLENHVLWAQGFAYDVVVLINGQFLSTICELMQNTLYLVQRWCGQVGLSVNPNKTTAILSNLDGFIKPRLFGIELELQTQVKYLGGIQDFGLTDYRITGSPQNRT
jgi:Reverse transcriptase (RNA-dependent DNA polymerase)